MILNGRLIWGLSVIFGGAGIFLLYLAISVESFMTGAYGLVLVGVAATIIRCLPSQ